MGKRILAVANRGIIFSRKLVGDIHAFLHVRTCICSQVLNHLKNLFRLFVHKVYRTVLHRLSVLKNLCIICACYHLVIEKTVVGIIHGIQLNAKGLLSCNRVRSRQLFRQRKHVAPGPRSVGNLYAIIIKNLLIQISNLRLKGIGDSRSRRNA